LNLGAVLRTTPIFGLVLVPKYNLVEPMNTGRNTKISNKPLKNVGLTQMGQFKYRDIPQKNNSLF